MGLPYTFCLSIVVSVPLYLACPTASRATRQELFQGHPITPPSPPLSYSLDLLEPGGQPICTCLCSASVHLNVGFEVVMQVGTKSLGIFYSLLFSPGERINIMFVVQIGDPIRARQGSHQISRSSIHLMTIGRVYTCASSLSSYYSTGEHSSS